MESVFLGALFLLVVVLIGFAALNWIESKEIWNGGVNKETGQAWVVIEEGGKLQLYDGYHRISLNGLVVYPSITDALKKQRRKAKGRAW